MVTREQGRRRTTAVTVGLAAASLAGTLAVAATAYAEKNAGTPDPATTPGAGTTPGTGTTTDQDQPRWDPPPGGLGGTDDNDYSNDQTRGSS